MLAVIFEVAIWNSPSTAPRSRTISCHSRTVLAKKYSPERLVGGGVLEDTAAEMRAVLIPCAFQELAPALRRFLSVMSTVAALKASDRALSPS